MRSIRMNGIKGHHGTTMTPSIDDNYTLHCHAFYEAYFFINGELDYLVEGHQYHPTPYSLLLIPPRTFHGYTVRGDSLYERYACHFVPALLPLSMQEELLSPFHGKTLFFQGLKKYNLDYYMNSVLEVADLPERIQEEALTGRMIALLSQIYLISQKQERPSPRRETDSYSIDPILVYIGNNLDKKLSLDSLCNQFYISKNHLNRLFKSATGTTVNSYINHKRLTLAQQYIIDNQSATEAALNAGFGDYSNFYRTCRNILGVSPSELQKESLGGAK